MRASRQLTTAARLHLWLLGGCSAFDVIGVGWSKTGLMSLRRALDILGHRTYMMNSFAHDEPQLRAWLYALRNPQDFGAFSALVDRIVQAGFTAAVDTPIDQFFPALLRKFPQAMFVLTTRDPGPWFSSAMRHWALNYWMQFGPYNQVRNAQLLNEFHHAQWVEMRGLKFAPTDADRGRFIAAMEDHNDAVRAATTPDRQLDFRVEQGWGPLCAFLSLPEPGKTFPRKNTGGDIAGVLGQLRSSVFLYHLILGLQALLAVVLTLLSDRPSLGGALLPGAFALLAMRMARCWF